MGAPPPGLQRVLQHGAGLAGHGAAMVEQPGEEGERHRGEVHHQVRQSCAGGAGDLVRPLQPSHL